MAGSSLGWTQAEEEVYAVDASEGLKLLSASLCSDWCFKQVLWPLVGMSWQGWDWSQ